MSDFSTYLLSIVGVVLLGVLIQIILPEGTMSKYIQNIFALILIFVIISPVTTLKKSESQITSVFQGAEVEIDQSFLALIHQETANQLKLSVENDLNDAGLNGVSVTISINMLSSDFIVEKVELDLTNLVMNEEVRHINKYSKMKEVVLQNMLVEEENIVFYE